MVCVFHKFKLIILPKQSSSTAKTEQHLLLTSISILMLKSANSMNDVYFALYSNLTDRKFSNFRNFMNDF